MQLLLTGAAIDAATAESWGLVHRIVPADALQDVTRAVAASLCAHNPEAVQSGRDAFYAIDNLAFDEALRYLYGRFASLEASGGAAKGIAAFLENRR